jgi:tetraacyldisaccharide 4'-kinase
MGLKPVDSISFADHHRYGIRDVEAILDRMRRSNADAIVTTEKDAVKLGRFDELASRIYVSRIFIEPTDEEKLMHLIRSRLT